jgi:hypothetical protein
VASIVSSSSSNFRQFSILGLDYPPLQLIQVDEARFEMFVFPFSSCCFSEQTFDSWNLAFFQVSGMMLWGTRRCQHDGGIGRVVAPPLLAGEVSRPLLVRPRYNLPSLERLDDAYPHDETFDNSLDPFIRD